MRFLPSYAIIFHLKPDKSILQVKAYIDMAGSLFVPDAVFYRIFDERLDNTGANFNFRNIV